MIAPKTDQNIEKSIEIEEQYRCGCFQAITWAFSRLSVWNMLSDIILPVFLCSSWFGALSFFYLTAHFLFVASSARYTFQLAINPFFRLHMCNCHNSQMHVFFAAAAIGFHRSPRSTLLLLKCRLHNSQMIICCYLWHRKSDKQKEEFIAIICCRL